jgi:hypothetical protein
VPVTQSFAIVSLWSQGPTDGDSKTKGFELTVFRRTVAEWESALKKLSSEEAGTFANGNGAIVGVVTDASGAVLPGARVMARRAVTGREWTVDSGGEGRFALRDLPSGWYVVKVTLAGFDSAVVTQVPVVSRQSTELDVSLEVARFQESIEVAAESPPVDTKISGTTSALVDRRPHAAPPPLVTPRVRRDFPETLYWQPALETDAAGTARIPLKLADTVTTWRLAAVASTTDGRIAHRYEGTPGLPAVLRRKRPAPRLDCRRRDWAQGPGSELHGGGDSGEP